MSFRTITDNSNGKKSTWFYEENEQWHGQAMGIQLEVDKQGLLDSDSDKQQNQILFDAKSPYQHVQVFQSESYGKVLLLDGVIQLTDKDECSYQEMITHIPMFSADTAPKNVLIIGGGDGGVLREVCKHKSVERVVQCEIDELVVKVSKKYFPEVSKCYPKLSSINGTDTNAELSTTFGPDGSLREQLSKKCQSNDMEIDDSENQNSDSDINQMTVTSAELDDLDQYDRESCMISKSKNTNGISIELHIEDAYKYIQTCKDKSFDVIIVDSSDPVGPAEKLFTKEFYANFKRVLTPGGCVSTQGECIWLHEDFMFDQYKQNRDLFCEAKYAICNTPTYPCGQISFFVGRNGGRSESESKKYNSLKEPSRVITGDMSNADMVNEAELKFYSTDMHRAAFALPRFIERKLYGN